MDPQRATTVRSESNEDDNHCDEEEISGFVGSYSAKVKLINADDSGVEEEIMLLWGIQQPIFSKPNALVKQSSLQLKIDSCGRCLTIHQSPSSLTTPGVTGSVMWDSGIVLAKFLEHSVASKAISLLGKNVVELGSGCGLVGCVSALLGANVVLTDLPDRLRLLRKNVEDNLYGDVKGRAEVKELTWGDDLSRDLTDPFPDFIFGSDVVYSEGAVLDLMETLLGLCGTETTVILAGELRNDAVLEYFLEAVTKEFVVGRIDQQLWHHDYRSSRVAIYVLAKKFQD